jgi:hypothetical protein
LSFQEREPIVKRLAIAVVRASLDIVQDPRPMQKETFPLLLLLNFFLGQVRPLDPISRLRGLDLILY